MIGEGAGGGKEGGGRKRRNTQPRAGREGVGDEGMLRKHDYVRYAGEGGLYLWDSECQVRWHSLSASDRTDWLLFFDACREEPTVHTEAIITAIMNGLCPHKTEALFDEAAAE